MEGADEALNSCKRAQYVLFGANRTLFGSSFGAMVPLRALLLVPCWAQFLPPGTTDVPVQRCLGHLVSQDMQHSSRF